MAESITEQETKREMTVSYFFIVIIYTEILWFSSLYLHHVFFRYFLIALFALLFVLPAYVAHFCCVFCLICVSFVTIAFPFPVKHLSV